MATSYTSLLGLALPVTGELSGTWGDTVNTSITSLLDTSVAGTTNVSTDADVTLTTTTGAANTARQAILLFSGARTVLRTVTAPAQSKIYTVINATTGGFAVKLVGAGPTTGLTIPNGASATVAWNGSDFIEVGTASIGNLTVNGNLTVTGTSTLTGAITNTAGTANGVTYLNGSKVLTSGSALVFDGTNLGVGVTPSAWSGMRAFQLGDGTFAMSSDGAGAGDGSLTWNGYYNGTNWIYGYTGGGSSRYRQTELGHAWFYAALGTAGNAITYTQAMTLDASGNLGIGTTSPSDSSGFGKCIDIRSSSGAAIYLRDSDDTTNDTFTIGRDNADSYLNSASGNMLFLNAGSERARIDSSGNLLVGTTNASGTAGLGFKVLANATGAAATAVTDQSTNGGQTNYNYYSTGAGAYRFYVGAGGTVFATSAVISAISDQRLKENVRDIDTGLNEIMALKPRRFDWKEGKGQDKKNVAGFIAQEFETVFPECVGTSKAGKDGIEYKNINHETLIPTFVKAIQEQQALITQLQADVAALKA